MKPRPGTDPTGMVSTMKTIFSFGNRITSVELEWLRPRYFSSSVVPPSLIVLLLPTVSSGITVCGSLIAARRSLARLCAITRGAGVLERLAAGDVVEVVVAVDQVLDRLVGDLLDLVDVLLPAGRPAVGDRIGGDHARIGDDEHRLMVAVAEDVDVVGAVDLGGLDLRPGGRRRRRRRRWRGRRGRRCGGLLCLCRSNGGDQSGRHQCKTRSCHRLPP